MFRRAPIVLLLIALSCCPALAGGGFDPFKPGKSGASSLEIVDGIPRLVLEGSPREMGEAQGRLLAKEGKALVRFFLKPASFGLGGIDGLVAEAMKMDPHIPERFQREMKAIAKATDQDYGLILAGVAYPDVYRGGGCSTLAATSPATKDGKPLLARNLDFFPMGVLDKYGMVTLCRPEGYHAFLSVTWPCLIGVLSGMNDAGLCCAVMEVRSGSRSNDGMPSTLLFRRVMEEASTTQEGLAILKEAGKVASNNLILLDAGGDAAVAEIGPGHFEVRFPEKGVIYATNHHRVGKDRFLGCWRFNELTTFCKERRGGIDVESLKEVLHDVHQKMTSIQSMVFEPAALKLHLSMGSIPSTKGPFQAIRLSESNRPSAPILEKTTR